MRFLRSFAIWYSKIQPEPMKKELTVHINLWNKDNKSIYCFDFGLMVEDINGIDGIYLYCPFKVTKKQIKDLGSVISEHKLVNAIFNENYTTTNGEPKRLLINDPKNPFVIYSLEIENQLQLMSFEENILIIEKKVGTIIKIDVKSINPNSINKYYFRLRIEAEKSNLDFINEDIKGISAFSNTFTNTEIIDFRLNDTRSFREELKEKFYDGDKFSIKGVHYLILRDANDSIIHYGENINSRILEKNLWNNYIEGANRNIIAYHIKKKSKKNDDGEWDYIEDFSNLSRFQYQRNTWRVIFIYIAVIIILGAIGGVFGNWLSILIGLN